MLLNRSLLSNAKLDFELNYNNIILIYFLGFWLLIYFILSILAQNSEHRLMNSSDSLRFFNHLSLQSILVSNCGHYSPLFVLT